MIFHNAALFLLLIASNSLQVLAGGNADGVELNFNPQDFADKAESQQGATMNTTEDLTNETCKVFHDTDATTVDDEEEDDYDYEYDYDYDEDEYYDDEEEDDTQTSEASITAPAPKSAVRFGSNLGVTQNMDVNHRLEIEELLEEASKYMEEVVMAEDKYRHVRSICENKHASCAFWSVLGECENNPGFMKVNCGPVCKSCEMLHIETRCPMDPTVPDALYPGDIDKLFERIVSSPDMQQYEPIVVSRPPEGPWLLMFENAISALEAQVLIDAGEQLGYERSADVGAKQKDGSYARKEYSGRTSTNAWCVDECYTDPIAQRVMQRIENITGIPEINSENLQLLQYQKAQFYNSHTDYIDYQVNRPTGVRVLTFYMYLNDVEEGGGTRFPKLNVTVQAKRGRAALWPSVLNSDPNAVDFRTNHEALPVIKGVKYGANAWIHQRDFKTNNLKGC